MGVVRFALLGSSPSASEGRVHMDDTTSFTLDQAHEDILTYTVSDEALEAAALAENLYTNFTCNGCGPGVPTFTMGECGRSA